MKTNYYDEVRAIIAASVNQQALKRWANETRSREPLLRAAFYDAVQPNDWRAPIDTEVTTDKLNITVEAIRFYTATEPEIEPIASGLWRVRSVGYREGPAGP